jgi:DNA-binding LacI/PurR family transcriptional regulator
VAFDDLTALGAIRALAEAGRSVPADCSVIGFDDAPLAAFCTPALTTIQQPMEAMGAYASEWVVKTVEPSPAAARIFPPALVVRASTAPLD